MGLAAIGGTTLFFDTRAMALMGIILSSKRPR
jgi:hypothetical protein